MRGLAGLAACAVLICSCASTLAPSSPRFLGLRQAEIQAVTASGTHRFVVWIAADDESRERGLMFVRELAPDRGMLFLFDFPQEVAFWMKDTYLPLDLVFIDPAGEVLRVAANAKPLSLDPIESGGKVVAVLEVLAGTARSIGLAPSDRISLPSLRTTSGLQPDSPDTAHAARALRVRN